MELIQFKSIGQLFRHKRRVYLDSNATTAVSRYVRQRMNHTLKHAYGNPSSLYEVAQKAARLVEEARQKVAQSIRAQPAEITFTSCATEANNQVLKSLSLYCAPNRRTIVASPIEHPSVMETLRWLQTQGIQVKYCPVDHQGRIAINELEKLIDTNTFLVCCMLANNELGTIQPIAAISEIAHRHGAWLMSDCAQALGKIPIDVVQLGVDYATFSAHKLHGPKGIGALYVKNGCPITPLVHGGHQEDGLRAGTESVHNIVGFGAACDQVNQLLHATERIGRLRAELVKKLQLIHPEMQVNTPQEGSLPNTLNLTFPGIDNTGMVAALDFSGIAVSAGSACSMPENKPSQVLTAIGLSEQEARESIRISLGNKTNRRDILYASRIFAQQTRKQTLTVNLVTPKQLTLEDLKGEMNYILDVRPAALRKKYRGLIHSHAISFFELNLHLKDLPRNKPILLVCQHGNLSYAATYYLQNKGFTNVSSLWRGISGWLEMYGEAE